MIANIIVVGFIGLMVYWWSTQGLFSAFMHLVITIIAGVLSLALWEIVSVDLVIGMMPNAMEYAWGVGLLLPFIVFLGGLRLLFDRYIPGNVEFDRLTNLIGGGAMGFLSGTLAAGILMIGLCFIGASPLGYQPKEVNASGEMVSRDSLWIPADKIAGSFFTMLSDKAMAPFSKANISNMHGNLAEAAARFRLQSREGARHALNPNDFTQATWTKTTGAHEAFKREKAPKVQPKQTLLMVDTVIANANKGFDPDGVFTVFPQQVVLGYYPNPQHTNQIEGSTPLWYIQRNGYGKIGTYATSKVSVGEEEFTWAFAIPDEAEPAYITIKEARHELGPDQKAKDEKLLAKLDKVSWTNKKVATLPPDEVNTEPVTVDDIEFRISDRLPFALNANSVSTLSGTFQKAEGRDYNVLSSLDATVQPANENLQDSISVQRLDHSQNTAIVQVVMKMDKFTECSKDTNAQSDPPILIDADGDEVKPVGYSVGISGESYINYRPSRPIQDMSGFDVLKYPKNKTITIYFRVGKNARLTEFRVGKYAQKFNLTAK